MKFLDYCRELKFDEKPDYNYLTNLLEDILDDEDLKIDFVYDWSENNNKEYTITNSNSN